MNDKQETNESALTAVTEAAASLIDGISLPAPVRRNALKAFDQLCAALVDVPIAYLEGFSQAKRAENTARADLIRHSGEQIKAGIEVDSSYARAAAAKYAQKIVRERRSLDQVASIAADQLEKLDDTAPSDDTQEISSDWINSFENEASQKSSSEMQELFGNILAGEITKPGTFSIRAVKILGQMDARAAELFQKLCSMTISLQAKDHFFDARVASLAGSAASNSLNKYGLSFDNLSTLQEYGLVISDLNSWMDYRPAIVHNNSVSIGLTHAGKLYGLVPKQERQPSAEFRVHGVMLTKAGRELMKVVPLLPSEDYTRDLIAYLDSSGFTIALVQGYAT